MFFANVFRILFVKTYKFFSLFKEVFYVNLFFWRNCNFSRDLFAIGNYIFEHIESPRLAPLIMAKQRLLPVPGQITGIDK